MSSSLGGYGGMKGSTATGKWAGDKIPKGYKGGQMAQFTPEQMGLFQQLFSQVSPESYTSKLAGGDQSLFDEMEAPAMRQFQGLQGQLASRFSGMGTGGRKTSGFQNTMGAEASNFAQDLASRRQSLQRQAIEDLMGMGHTLLNEKPYQRHLIKKHQDEGFNWGGLGGAAVGGVGGFFAGGPVGALQGAGMGYNIGSGLSGRNSQSGFSGDFSNLLPSGGGSATSRPSSGMNLSSSSLVGNNVSGRYNLPTFLGR